MKIKFNKNLRFYGLILILIGILGVSFLLYNKYLSSNDSLNAEKVSLIIFPLENLTGNPNLDNLSINLPDNLNNTLAKLPNVRIKTTADIKKYIGKAFNPMDEGKILGVENVVTGSIQAKNNLLIVTLRLTDISKSNQITQQRQFETTKENQDNLQNLTLEFLMQQLNLSKQIE